MARFDRTEVFFTTLSDRDLVYHLMPNWQYGDGWVGKPHVCNGYRAPIQSHPTTLPDLVASPCGAHALVYLVRGSDPDCRPEYVGRQHLLPHLHDGEQGRMSFPYPTGAEMPRGHADKIGRPCKRCFPSTSKEQA